MFRFLRQRDAGPLFAFKFTLTKTTPIAAEINFCDWLNYSYTDNTVNCLDSFCGSVCGSCCINNGVSIVLL